MNNSNRLVAAHKCLKLLIARENKSSGDQLIAAREKRMQMQRHIIEIHKIIYLEGTMRNARG